MLDAPHSMMNKFGGPNDPNFGLVSSAIKKMVEEAIRIAVSQREGICCFTSECSNLCRDDAHFYLAFHLHNEHFMVPRRPNTLFTGREKEIGKLKQALSPSLSTTAHAAVPKVYVIYGMGGAGKSEVALKFAHENRPE